LKIIIYNFYDFENDARAIKRRRAAVRSNQIRNVAIKILWLRPANSVSNVRKNPIKVPRITSDRINAERWKGRHFSCCLKRRDSRIVAGIRLKKDTREAKA